MHNDVLQKNGESEISRVMIPGNSAEYICRRCATELDIHIGQ